jgi:hypothetical protein
MANRISRTNLNSGASATCFELPVPISTRSNTAAIAVVRAKADRHAAQVRPVIAAIRTEGITTHSGIARKLNALGVLAPRGGRWTSTSVANLLARALPRGGSAGTRTAAFGAPRAPYVDARPGDHH